MRLGRPGEDEEQSSKDRAKSDAKKSRVPAVMLHDVPEAPAGKGSARVTKNAREAHGGRGAAFGGEVRAGDGE